MTISERIDELEEGFRHLVQGTLAIVRVLQEENALLLARIDERRTMPTEVQLQQPVPLLPVPLPPQLPSEPLKRWQRLVEKQCADCGNAMMGTINRKLCQGCFKVRMQNRSQRMKT